MAFSITQTVDTFMTLVLTHVCQMKCPFCIDQYRGSQEFMAWETVQQAILLGREKGVLDALLVGGEPTEHPDCVRIAQALKTAGFRVIMTTNFTNPEMFWKLDGIVDCFNISYYSQPDLPTQAQCKSDLTYSTLIHQKHLNTKELLDAFIDRFEGSAHLKFSTLDDCNEWTSRNLGVPYLDALDCEKVELFGEIEGLLYRGHVIKRHDKILNGAAKQSIKVHVDGEISCSWVRTRVEV